MVTASAGVSSNKWWRRSRNLAIAPAGIESGVFGIHCLIFVIDLVKRGHRSPRCLERCGKAQTCQRGTTSLQKLTQNIGTTHTSVRPGVLNGQQSLVFRVNADTGHRQGVRDENRLRTPAVGDGVGTVNP